MALSVWIVLSVVLKYCLYLTACIAIGVGYMRLRHSEEARLLKTINRYYLQSIICGLLTAVVYFLVQVGSFAEEGFNGAFNSLYINMLWQSPVGNALLQQLLGFLLMGVIHFSLAPNNHLAIRSLGAICTLIGAILIANTFAFVGHTAELAWPFRLFLLVHFLGVAWWIGSLLPLRQACDILIIEKLQAIMTSFGKTALGVVLCIIFTGLLLLYNISDGSFTIFQRLYGWLFIAKLAGVSGILLIALYHKLYLVSQLKYSTKAKMTLKHSITREIILGLSILFITAILSTATGPNM
ncbi:copper resistance D family protein [Aliikangiella sp. IMCC44632]